MVTRHELLARLHHLLQPKLYLEVGVHTGESLKLASCYAIGIDPAPHVAYELPNARIFPITSDEYFERHTADEAERPAVELAFIDGMHLWEYAMRDFLHIEQICTPKAVIVFDDMLPRNQGEAARVQCPGDWTGDVWKVYYLLKEYRPGLTLRLVDTFPTGTLVVWDLDRVDAVNDPDGEALYRQAQDGGGDLDDWLVPDDILFRTEAIQADVLLDELKERR